MSSCKLSVVVTSYNYEKYIAETLTSLVRQTRKDFEIVVIDDGSRDNSVEIIRSFCTKNKNIHFIQHPDKKNHGLCASVKRAVEYASGEYVAFCESDDFWDERHVEILLEYIETVNPDLIFNELVVINTSHNMEYNDYVQYSNEFLKKNSGKNIFMHLEHNPMPTFSSACVRRDILMACDYHSLIPSYLDFWLWRQICLFSPIYYAEGCRTYWRKHDESYDMVENVKNIDAFLVASNKLLLKGIKMSALQKIVSFFLALTGKKSRLIRYEMRVIWDNIA